MKCENIMSRGVKWIEPGESVGKAARVMAFHGVGLIPICEAGGVIRGVLTDRDVALRVVARKRDAENTPVSEVMTKELIFGPPDMKLKEAEELMVRAGVSRLLVLEPNSDVLMGIISLNDIGAHDRDSRFAWVAREIAARELPDRRSGEPVHADEPQPEFFHGEREPEEEHYRRRARRTARDRDAVIRGGSMKEFGG